MNLENLKKFFAASLSYEYDSKIRKIQFDPLVSPQSKRANIIVLMNGRAVMANLMTVILLKLEHEQEIIENDARTTCN